MGQAINKTVTIGAQAAPRQNVAMRVWGSAFPNVDMLRCAAEIIKRRIPGLHQETVLQSLEIKDTWQPFEVRAAEMHPSSCTLCVPLQVVYRIERGIGCSSTLTYIVEIV